jgi:K(+)-stimulated pyrophosphate-energized sodium pump
MIRFKEENMCNIFLNFNDNIFIWLLGIIFLYISFGFLNLRFVLKYASGKGKQITISKMIREASFTYLKTQYKIIWTVGAIIFGLLLFKFSLHSSIFFILGVVSSSLAGFLSMYVSVNSNVKVVEAAATKGLSLAFQLSLFAGSSASILLNSIGLLSILITYFFGNSEALLCLSLGVSLVSVFARLGGGIFTKGADVGADLVGKSELGLDEDDPRNPAVIADNVGDNVGDVAGMGADLFESYVVSIVSSILILNKTIQIPFFICISGIFSAIIPLFFMKFKKVWQEMDRYFITNVFIFLVSLLIGESCGLLKKNDFICISIGIICVVLILKITEYFTSSSFKPVKDIAKASEAGHGTNVICGLAYGFLSVPLCILVIILGIMTSFYFGKIEGVTLGVLGIVGLSPSILVLDIFGPISDNAGGICEMSKLGPKIRKITDELDAVGNTTKAITKGYAICSAIFTSIAMFYLFYKDMFDLKGIVFSTSFIDPYVFCGLLLGTTVPFAFAGLSMQSVSKAAYAIVEEVRSQLNANKKIMEGKADPDYNKTVEFLTRFSIKEMILPSLLPVLAPCLAFAVGYYHSLMRNMPIKQSINSGFIFLASALMAITLTGSALSISTIISGGAWDNAKKYIEMEVGKGTDTHKAAVTGDTVGDPFKDTTGPALNSVIKLAGLVSYFIIYFV